VIKNIRRVLDYAGVNLCAEPGNRHGPLPCAELLAMASSFAGLDQATRARVVETALCRTYSAGASLLSAGERPQGLFVISEGVVEATLGVAADSQEFGRFGPGEFVGEAGLFGEVQPTSIKACGTVVGFEIPFDLLQEIAETTPVFTAQLRGVFEGRIAAVRTIDHAKSALEPSSAVDRQKSGFFERFHSSTLGRQLMKVRMQTFSSRRD